MGINQLPVAPAVGNPYGFRNKIRNGDFSVWQRGIGPFSTITGSAFTYAADGWFFDMTSTSTSATGFMARGVVTPGTGASRYASLIQVTGQNDTTYDYCAVTQMIEGVETLQGKKVTLSFESAVGTGTGLVGVEINQNFGSGGSPSTEVSQTLTPQSLNTTQTRKFITFTMPSITGKTRGTNNDDYVAVKFWFSAGSIFNTNSGSIGVQNNTWTLSRVQLEEGPVATPFEELPWALQTAWNQRYYYRWTAQTANDVVGWGTTSNATQAYIYRQFPVTMRAAPTYGTAGAFNISDRLANYPATASIAQSVSPHAADLLVTVGGGGMSAHWPVCMYAAAGAGNYVQFSAELQFT
jgi:hypothetical protein